MTSNGNDEVNHSPSKKAQNNNASQIKRSDNSMLKGLGSAKRTRNNMGLKRPRNIDPAGMCLILGKENQWIYLLKGYLLEDKNETKEIEGKNKN